MDFGLRNRSALVVAGTRGLGLACATALVNEGARVVINGRDLKQGESAEAKLGARAKFIAADLSKPEDRAKLIEEAEAFLGPISIAVLNGAGPTADLFLETPIEAWEQAFYAMLLPQLDIANRCAPSMTTAGWGRIISLSSISGKEISLRGSRPNALRAALVGALGTLAREVASSGVTVNSILSGPFDTPALRKVVRQHAGQMDLSEKDAVAHYANEGPMRRIGDPDELGAVCAFLASMRSSYVTGQAIVVDGGRVSTLY